MRRLKVAAALVSATLVLGGLAAPSIGATAAAKKKPPVKLSGKVANKGTKSVKSGAIEIEADDFYFKPTFIKGKAGSTVKVTIANEGSTAHTFTIDDQDISEEIRPGDEAEVDVTIPETGAANFYCEFHGDESGMQGAFFSKSGASASSGKSTDSNSESDSPGGYGY